LKHIPFQVSHYTHPISDHIIVSQSKYKNEDCTTHRDCFTFIKANMQINVYAHYLLTASSKH